MINYILLGLSVICAGLKSVFSKISNEYIDENNNIYSFNFYLFLTGGILIFLFGYGGGITFSAYTCGLALIYALFTLLSQILLIEATSCGDVALSSLFYSSGFLVPIALSYVFYKEGISPKQFIGIIVLLISFVVSVRVDKKINLKWLVLSISAMLAAGMVGFLQKMFRMSQYKAQMNGFLILVFVILIVAMLIIMPKNKVKPQKGFIKSAIVIGLCMGCVNILNLYLSGVLPSVIVFSVLNGGSIISSAVGANLILKEKLEIRKKIGILLGIVSIVLIAC